MALWTAALVILVVALVLALLGVLVLVFMYPTVVDDTELHGGAVDTDPDKEDGDSELLTKYACLWGAPLRERRALIIDGLEEPLTEGAADGGLHLSIEEIQRQVHDIISAPTDPAEQLKVVRKLRHRWHPDKNVVLHELAVKTSQCINEEQQKIEARLRMQQYRDRGLI
eukprot:TRINITY_DN7992_c0_g1_i1.p1 TRINITY_DN7992_c0_g1~~TRINITY_DN7992_c0_g1_i1.p1  ORF type:complete len:169 (-),score=29.69 TRINITY_DN7992_c0_g1_i1:181-687(-)